MIISKKLRDFILIYWLYDNIYKNEPIQLMDIKSEIKKFKQDLEKAILNYPSNSIQIVDIIEALDISEISNDVFLKKLDRVTQCMGDPDVYHLETLDVLQEKAILLMSEAKKIFQVIKNISDFKDAEQYFVFLDKIQALLAGFVFRDGLEVDKNTRIFIHDFERLDDLDLRVHLYQQIKANAYNFLTC